MKAFGIATIGMAALLLTATAPARPAAQNSPQNLFAPTQKIQAQADQANAAVLSPDTYRRAVKYLDQARSEFDRGKSPDRIRNKLKKADKDFHAARTNAELAKLTLAKAIESREAARQAEAARLAASDWKAAETTFTAAVMALERGKLKTAQKKDETAYTQFRTAELNAIRTLVLAEAWRLIARIHQQKLDRFAPQTLARAEQLAGHANELIIADRHALDRPYELADRAVYEAKHALLIATIANRIDEKEMTVETLILNQESSLAAIAEAANIKADFSAGPEKTSARIIDLLEELPGLRNDLKDRDAMIAGLEEEIRELDTELGGASADRSRLIRRLEQQARVREQFRQVENMFTNDEAIVLRDGDNLIVRLVGLNFASGSAKLGKNAAALLAKVQSAIEVFPQCGLTVEGHTDAQGNAGKNLALSGERAEAVKTWMTDVMHLPSFRITAKGYGDTRPISSNKTAEGRAKNRRIDLIITPGK